MKFESERVFGFLKAVFVVLLISSVTYGVVLLVNMFSLAAYIIGGYFCLLVITITAAEIRTMFDKTKYFEYEGEITDCWENILKMDYLRYVSFDFHQIYFKQMMTIITGLWALFTSFLESIKDTVLSFKNLLIFVWLLFSSVIGLRFFYNIYESKKYSMISKRTEAKFESDIIKSWLVGFYRNSTKTWKNAYKSSRGIDRTKIINEFMASTHIRKNTPLYGRIIKVITKYGRIIKVITK